MHSSRFAEWMLSLVTPQAHAASMVGDFTESSQGKVWFWSSVLRAGFSLLWKDVAASPGRMAGLAVGGAAMQMAFAGPLLMCTFVMAAILGFLNRWLNCEASWLIAPIFGLMVLSAAIPSPYLVGRWLARRAPGQELAPCLALTALTGILWSAAYLIWGQEVSLMNGLSGVVPTLLCLLVANISLYAGAIWARLHPSEPRWFEAMPFILLKPGQGSAARFSSLAAGPQRNACHQPRASGTRESPTG